MRKFITWVLIILGALWLLGSCDGCGGCDDCSGGCDLTSGCESCVDLDACEKQYKGEITMNIHKYDGTILTIKGNRERGKKNCIINNSGEYETFGSYTVPERIGLRFEGLEYKDENGNYKTLLDSNQYISYNYLWRIKDKSEIDVYERWSNIYYRVCYVTSAGQFGSYRLDFDYYIGSQIEFTNSVENVFNSESHPRKTQVGYTAYYVDINGKTVEFPWVFGQTFNETHIAHFENVRYGEKILIKANWVSDTVKVELNFNVTDGNDVGNVVKTLTVGYDEDLSKYFGEYVNVQNRQFFGWYLDEDLTAKAPKEISANYKDTPLKLYAKHLEFKEIYIDLQDGKGAKEARAYEDGTFLIKNDSGVYAIEIPGTKDGKQFYGLSLDPQVEKRTLYGAIIPSGTYYAIYI